MSACASLLQVSAPFEYLLIFSDVNLFVFPGFKQALLELFLCVKPCLLGQTHGKILIISIVVFKENQLIPCMRRKVLINRRELVLLVATHGSLHNLGNP